MPLTEVLSYGDFKLGVLYNEAERQRAVDAVYGGMSFSGDDGYFDKVMKIHGAYTKGFYENERKQFEEYIKGGKS